MSDTDQSTEEADHLEFAGLGPLWQIQQMRNGCGALDALCPDRMPGEIRLHLIRALSELKTAIATAEIHRRERGPW